MTDTGSDPVAWARAHGAAFEIEPLHEMVKGRQVQVGFTINLYARLPMDQRPREERWKDAEAIRARLEQMLQTLAPPAGGPARLEIQPARTAAFMAGGTGAEPEIAVTGRVFHGGEYFKEVTEGEEKRAREAVRRLTDLGLKERRHGIS